MAKNPRMFTKANADLFWSNVDEPDEESLPEVDRDLRQNTEVGALAFFGSLVAAM
jgi:hypothetical protein